MISIGTITGKIELQDAWTNVSKAVETSLGSLGAKAETAAGKVAHVGGSAAAAGPSVLSFAGSFKVLENAATSLTHHLHDPVSALGELREGLESPRGALTSLASGLATSLPTAAVASVAALGAIGVAEGLLVEQLFELTEGAAATGVAIEEFSLKAQISVASASELRFVAKALGKDVDSLGNAMFMMSRRVGEGSTAVQQGLRGLGLSWKEFSGLAPDEQLLQVSDALRALPPEVNKATIVFDIMGRQGREMLPLLLRPMRELTEQGRELGVAWSEDDVHAAHEFEVATNKLRFEMSRFGTTLGKEMMPAFSSLVETLSHSKAVMEGIPLIARGVAAGIDAIFQIRPGAAIIAGALDKIDKLLAMMPGHADAASEALRHMHEQEAKGQPTPMPSHLTPTSMPPMASHADAAAAAAASQADATRLAKLNTDLMSESTTKLSAGIVDYIKKALQHHHTTEEISKALVDARLAGEEAKPTIEALGRAHTTAQQAADAHAKALADIAGASVPLTETQRALASSLLAQGVGHGEVAKAVGVSTLAIQKFAEVERSALTLGVSGSAAAKELDILKAAWDAQPPAVQATVAAQQLLLDEYGKFSGDLTTLTPKQAEFVAQLNGSAIAAGRMSMGVSDVVSNIDGLGKVVKDTGHTLMIETQAWETALTNLGQRTGVKFEIPAELLGKQPAFDEIKYINDVIDLQDQLTIAHKRGLDKQLAEQETAKRKQLEAYAAIYGAGSDTYKKLEADVVDYYDTLARDTAHQHFLDGLEAMSQAFANFAQVATGSLSQTFKELAQIVSLANIGAKAGENMSDSFSGLGATMSKIAEGEISIGAGAGELAGGFANLAASALAAASAMEQATTAGSRAHRVLGGAATGAAIGSNFGPYGAIIGLAAGAIYGALRTTDADRAVSEIGKEWGLTISSEMGKAIEETMKTKFAGMKNNRWMAEVFDIGQMISDVGGLKADNIVAFTEQVRQAFVFLDEGAFKVEDVNHVLEDSFGQLTDYYTSRNAMVSAGVIDLIHLDEQLGVHSKSVADFVKAQAGIAAQGFNDISKNFLTMVSGFQTGSEDMKMLLESINGPLTGGADSGPHEAPEAHIGTTERNRKKPSAGGFAPEFLADVEKGLKRIGPIAEATFGALLAGGASFTSALATMAPGIEQVQKALQATGQHADGFLGQLIGWEAIVSKNKELFEILQGVDESLTGLQNAGRMTQGAFSALASITTDSINTLLGQGVATADAFQMAQPQLQKIWELERDFNYQVDSGTQALLDQAEAAGVVGDAHRTVQDQMLRATEDIRDAVVGLAGVFGVDLPKNMQEAADRAASSARDIQGSFDQIDPTIHVHYDVPKLNVPTPGAVTVPLRYGSPTGGGSQPPSGGTYVPPRYQAAGGAVYLAGGGSVGGDGWMAGIARHHAAVNYLANGGAAPPQTIVMEPRGTDTVPAMLTPGEVVVPSSVVDKLGMSFFNRLIAGTFTAPPIHTMLDIDTNTAAQRLGLIEQARSFVLTPIADVSDVDAQLRDLTRDISVGVKSDGLSALIDSLDEMEKRYREVLVHPNLDESKVAAISDRLDVLAQVRDTVVNIRESGVENVAMAISGLPRESEIKAVVVAEGFQAALDLIAKIPGYREAHVRAMPDGFVALDELISRVPTTHQIAIPFEPAGVAQVMSQIASIPRQVGVTIKPEWQQASGTPPTALVRRSGERAPSLFATGGSVSAGAAGAAAAIAATVMMAAAPTQALAMGGSAVEQAHSMGVAVAGRQPVYAAAGGARATFAPVGTDTVPAMLTPGEYVLPTRVVDRVGIASLDALRSDRATIVNVAPSVATRNGDVLGDVSTSDNRAFGGPFSAVSTGPTRVSSSFRSLSGSVQTELSDRRDCSSVNYALGGAVDNGVSSAVSHRVSGSTMSIASHAHADGANVSSARHYALGGSVVDASRYIDARMSAVHFGGSDTAAQHYAYGGQANNVQRYSFGGHVSTARYETGDAIDASRHALGGVVSSAVSNFSIGGPAQVVGDRVSQVSSYQTGGSVGAALSAHYAYGGPVHADGDRIETIEHYASGGSVEAAGRLNGASLSAAVASRYAYGGPVQTLGDRISTVQNYAVGGAVSTQSTPVAYSHYALGGPVQTTGDRIATVQNYATGGPAWSWRHDQNTDGDSVSHYALGGPVIPEPGSASWVLSNSTSTLLPRLPSPGIVIPKGTAGEDWRSDNAGLFQFSGGTPTPGSVVPMRVPVLVETADARRALAGLTAPDVPVNAVADVSAAARAIDGLPDARTLSIQASGVAAVERDMAAVSRARDVTLSVVTSGLSEAADGVSSIPEQKQIDVILASANLQQVLDEIASIPRRVDVAVVYAGSPGPIGQPQPPSGGGRLKPPTGSGGGITTRPSGGSSLLPPPAHGGTYPDPDAHHGGIYPDPGAHYGGYYPAPYPGTNLGSNPAYNDGWSSGAFRLAVGGLVPGPSVAQAASRTFGTDRVRALLTPGEFVVPAPTVAAIGVDYFTRLVTAGAASSSQREALGGAWTGSWPDIQPAAPSPALGSGAGSAGPSWLDAPEARGHVSHDSPDSEPETSGPVAASGASTFQFGDINVHPPAGTPMTNEEGRRFGRGFLAELHRGHQLFTEFSRAVAQTEAVRDLKRKTR